ncbi:hypothetical protein L1987_64755 [Smallanthus sonchifolius]|uniref:Uncharacterized protein n=1 Tax=Smallanthus sonchifolius TaxID=185202 RepID=A0ACB9BSK6_9ASTR|nr:hypothetical protein L1987_64755 [Smallanthus sonchifolius]
MVSQRPGKKNAGMGYKNFPPPVLNTMVNTPDDNPITDFKVKTSLVVDPTENKISQPKVNDNGASTSESQCVDGMVEEWDEDDDECPTRGLGHKNSSAPQNDSIGISKSASKNVFKIKQTNCRPSYPTTSDQKSQVTKASIKKVNFVKAGESVQSNKSLSSAELKEAKAGGSKTHQSENQYRSPSSTPVQIVKQSTVYHKQSLHKQHVWKAKSDDASDDCTSKSSGCSKSPQGQWMDCTVVDETGKPKTVKAWVPNLN